MTNPHAPARRRLAALALGVALAAGATGAFASSAAQAAPPSTSAVPDTLKLAGALAHQSISWEDCTFSREVPEEIRTQLENWKNLQCATVKVPQDWHNPGNGKTFDLRISYVKNVEQSSPAYTSTYLVNPGGPGGEGIHWAPNMLRRAPELAANFNALGIDPRGVGQSEAPRCLTEIDDAADYSVKDLMRIIGQTCSTVEAATKISTEQTSYDFDFVRGLLGIPKITYIGYSYGTWLGAWYGKLFGPNIDRMILDSALDGTMQTLQPGWDLQPVARDRQFNDAVLPYTARVNERLGVTQPKNTIEYYRPRTAEKTEQLYWEGVDAWIELAGGDPGIVGALWTYAGGLAGFADPSSYPQTAATVNLFIDRALLKRDQEGRVEDPVTGEIAKPVPEGTAAAAARLAAIDSATTPVERGAAVAAAVDAGLSEDALAAGAPVRAAITEALATPTALVTAEAYNSFDAIRCNDGQWTQGEAYWDQWAVDVAKNTPFNAMIVDQLYPACAWWPTKNPTMPTADKKTFPQTIVIQAEEDSQTGYEGGLTSGTKLPNTTFIAVDNATKHGYFPYRTSCVDDPAFAFLMRGASPKKTTVCQGKPLPDDAATYEMWSPINVNGKHVPGNGTIPSRVQDPETGVADWDVAKETAVQEAKQAVLRTLLPTG